MTILAHVPMAEVKIEKLNDYAQALITISQLRLRAREALNAGRWAEACDCADEIIISGRRVRVYCLDKLEKEA